MLSHGTYIGQVFVFANTNASGIVGGVVALIINLVSFLHPLNASLPILATVSGSSKLVMPLQFLKALLPIVSTLLPTVQLVKPLQP